jgi:argininosuccinate lyase
MQEDKNLVFDSYDVLMESILIAKELIKNLSSNKQRMLFLANKGYTTATDFADYLVQKKNLSFREAYKISGKIVDYAEKNNKKLDELSMNEIKKVKKDLNKDVMKVFSVKNSINLKTSHGGTSIKNIKTVLSKLKKEFK